MEKPLAIVTGASRGIGLAITRKLLAADYAVVMVSRCADTLNDAAATLSSPDTLPLAADISNEADVLNLFRQLDEQARCPNVLINNAGIGIFDPLTETTVEDWDRVLAINARGTFLCTREAMKRMQPNGGGRIINIGSVVSRKGYSNQGAYTAAKHAMLGLTKVTAVEGQPHNIIAQAILPGGVDTEMATAARPDLDTSILMHPDDVADAVCFCLGQTGNAITDTIQLRRRGSTPFA